MLHSSAGAALLCGGLDSWPKPLLLGHRGSRESWPENTLEAMQHAAEQGAHGFEIDVRLNGDGSVVVFHDQSLQRLTEGRDLRAISQLSDAQLANVRLAQHTRIPTLQQVLDYCRSQRLLLNVEIKSDGPRRPLVRNVIRLLRGFPREQLLVSSFDPSIVAAFRLAAPRTERAIIIGQRSLQLRLDHLSRPLGGPAICVDHEQIDERRLARWSHRQRVICWTVNQISRVEQLRALGIDAFISDKPSELAPHLIVNG